MRWDYLERIWCLALEASSKGSEHLDEYLTFLNRSIGVTSDQTGTNIIFDVTHLLSKIRDRVTLRLEWIQRLANGEPSLLNIIPTFDSPEVMCVYNKYYLNIDNECSLWECRNAPDYIPIPIEAYLGGLTGKIVALRNELTDLQNQERDLINAAARQIEEKKIAFEEKKIADLQFQLATEAAEVKESRARLELLEKEAISKLVYGTLVAVHVKHGSGPSDANEYLNEEGKRALKRRRFWLAVVQRVLDDMTVDVEWMWATEEYGNYSPWRGKDKNSNIRFCAIITVLDSTTEGKISNADKSKIEAALFYGSVIWKRVSKKRKFDHTVV